MVIDPLDKVRSIRVERVAGGVRATVMPRSNWRQFLRPVYCFTLLAFALPRAALIPFGRFRWIWAELAGIFVLVFVVLAVVSVFDGTLERGTIESDGRALWVNLRVLWGRRRRFAKDDMRAVRVVCVAYSSKGRGEFEPRLALQIFPWEGKPTRLLKGRSGRDLIALAEALSSSLGISREQRRQEWLKSQLEKIAAEAQSKVLSYGAEVWATTLEVAPQRVVLSLLPHGLAIKAAVLKIEAGVLSCMSGETTQAWGIDQIHWLGVIDDQLAYSTLVAVLDDGTVQKLLRVRPMAELAYAAKILNSALGLTAGEQA